MDPMSAPVVEYRRALHQIPELDDQLPETLNFVRSRLEALPLTLSSPIPGSLCAYLDAGQSETVAFRADLDALPVLEQTGLPFASRHAGTMHACGHDGHTAIALALVEYAAARREHLPRNVLFVFQPAEETTGGAQRICQSGIFSRYHVVRIFGLHLWPGLPEGSVWCRPGPQMARSSEISFYAQGRSVHISRYPEGRDALLAGAEFLRRAYTMAEEELEPEVPRVLRFGKMTSGTVCNAISGQTELLGSLRSFSDDSFNYMTRRLREIADQVAHTSGCQVRLEISEGYPPVCNHAGLYDTLCAALGSDAPRLLEEPALAAEDFSFYQQVLPGVFFFLGVGNSDPLHAPTYRFDDERVLPCGVEFMKKLLLLP